MGIPAQDPTKPLTQPAKAPRRRRWLRYLSYTLVALLLISIGGAYGYARRSLPQIEGVLQLSGLSAPVSVYRDEWGVPHIEAANSHDLFMAQGYVTAQDRLFQMDATRRAAAGRLAEVMGEGLVNTDKYYRAIMARRSAERSMANASPQARAMTEAYAAGVNAFMEQAREAGRLPVEFTILGYQPEPWTPLDSFSILKLMADDLGGNWPAEVFRYQAQQKLSPELAKELLPVYPDDGVTIMKYVADSRTVPVTDPAHPTALAANHGSGDIDLSDLLAAAGVRDEFIGSNNWVVSGKMTKSGSPLLANDPHLAMREPAIWYQSHLVITGEQEPLNVIGVTFAGLPGIVLGHNDKVAWGFTNTGPDVQDLYIEKRNPENPYQFEYLGKWENATVYPEDITVKGGKVIPFEVVVTRHGPIISEIAGDEDNRPAEALALRWTAHLATQEMDALLNINRADNWAEFRTGLQDMMVPTQNIVFAAVDGTIAYRPTGIVPIRKAGDGLAPVPGWTSEYEWNGYIPFDKLPEVVNPVEGFIATANNKVVDDAYPYFLTHSWAQPHRATRIAELLQGKTQLTAEDMQAIQFDSMNLQARSLLPVLLPPLAAAELADTEQAALGLLKAWDNVDSAEQGAPLVYHLWWKHLLKTLYEPTLGEDLFKRMPDRGIITDQMLLAAAGGKESAWIKQAGGLAQLTLTSFKAAVAEAATLQGKNPANWEWGKFHRVGPAHPIGSAVAPLGWFLNPELLPSDGSGVTVNAMGFNSQTGIVSSGPVWRQVVDLSNLGNSKDIVTPGQSGHFLSPWYESQAQLHHSGELHPQVFAPADYAKGKKLTLTP